jgi:predicted amidohydrolase
MAMSQLIKVAVVQAAPVILNCVATTEKVCRLIREAAKEYDQENILFADLDLDLIKQARFDFDPVGHYSRPDVFRLIVNEFPTADE